MFFRGVCCAYFICVGQALAATADDRANAMAECGYLAHVAVEQMKKLPERPRVFGEVVQDVVVFANLYFQLKDPDRTGGMTGLTGAMLYETATVGKAAHDKRTRAMSPRNALRLSNTVLNACRMDLRLLGPKLSVQ